MNVNLTERNNGKWSLRLFAHFKMSRNTIAEYKKIYIIITDRYFA